MDAVMCLSLGYVFGSFNPALFIAKLRKIDLRREGSGNPGATNTMLVMGLRWGIVVLICDLVKTLLARRVARALFPHLYMAGLIACCGAIIGHMFPLGLGFQGGKGVACLAATVMSFDFGIFLLMLSMGITLMFLCNYGVFAPVAVALLFPLVVLWKTESVWLWLLTCVVGLLVVYRHEENFVRIKNGEEIKVRSYFGERIRARLHCGSHEDDNNQ